MPVHVTVCAGRRPESFQVNELSTSVSTSQPGVHEAAEAGRSTSADITITNAKHTETWAATRVFVPVAADFVNRFSSCFSERNPGMSRARRTGIKGCMYTLARRRAQVSSGG